MIKLQRLNHGLLRSPTRTFSPSYISQVMRIYNLDYYSLYRFADIFSNDLLKDSANISPFKLIVDYTKWKVGKNRAPPRFQSSVKQTALFNTIQTLISQGIVEKSQSPHYSQILMVPRPDGIFCTCVDYRALNDCTADASWPIPNIAEMLRRIGSQTKNLWYHGPYTRIPSSSFNPRNKSIHCNHLCTSHKSYKSVL